MFFTYTKVSPPLNSVSNLKRCCSVGRKAHLSEKWKRLRDDLPMTPHQGLGTLLYNVNYTSTPMMAGNTAYGTIQPCSVGDHEKGAVPYLALVG